MLVVHTALKTLSGAVSLGGKSAFCLRAADLGSRDTVMCCLVDGFSIRADAIAPKCAVNDGEGEGGVTAINAKLSAPSWDSPDSEPRQLPIRKVFLFAAFVREVYSSGGVQAKPDRIRGVIFQCYLDILAIFL
jgi:hypothetical protein